jgi:hypothetical protein
MLLVADKYREDTRLKKLEPAEITDDCLFEFTEINPNAVSLVLAADSEMLNDLHEKIIAVEGEITKRFDTLDEKLTGQVAKLSDKIDALTDLQINAQRSKVDD